MDSERRHAFKRISCYVWRKKLEENIINYEQPQCHIMSPSLVENLETWLGERYRLMEGNE